MKKLIFLLTVAVSILACTGADSDLNQPMDDPNDGNNDGTSFVAQIEGVGLNADEVNTRQLTINGFGLLEITATNSDSRQSLQLQLPGDISTGSYMFDTQLSSESVLGLYIENPDVGEVFVSESGLLTVTEYNPNLGIIKGNTVFTLANSTGDGVIEVTFCEFSLTF